jgi:hypothetical protein
MLRVFFKELANSDIHLKFSNFRNRWSRLSSSRPARAPGQQARRQAQPRPGPQARRRRRAAVAAGRPRLPTSPASGGSKSCCIINALASLSSPDSDCGRQTRTPAEPG